MELLKGKQFFILLVIFATVIFSSVTNARLLERWETEPEVLENTLSNKRMQIKAQTETVSVSDFSDLEPATVTVWTDIGKSASVSCQTKNKEAIQACLWIRTSSATNKSTHFSFSNTEIFGADGNGAATATDAGGTVASTFITNANDNGNINGSISRNLVNYTPLNIIGRDMSSGFCGIIIRLITKNDFGSWMCILTTKGQGQTEVEETVEVLQWEPPKFKPNIEHKEMYSDLTDLKRGSAGTSSSNEESNIGRNSTRNAECCTNEGKPEPSLAFFIGNISIPQNEILTTTTLDRYLGKNLTCISWIKTKFTYRMNGQKLHCVMDHISFDENEKDSEIHQDSIRLNIEYPPILNGLRENSTRKITIPKNATILNVSVTAEGNPFPELSWEFQYNTRVIATGNATENVERIEADLSANFDVTTKNLTTDKIESTLVMKDPHNHLVFNDSAIVHVTNKYGTTSIRYVFLLDSDINKNNEGGSTATSTSKTNATTGSGAESPAYLHLIIFTIFGVCILAGIAGYIAFCIRRRRWPSAGTPLPVFLSYTESKSEHEPEPAPDQKMVTVSSDNEAHLHTARIVRVGARRLKSTSRNRANGEFGTATEVAPVKIIDKIQVNSKENDDIAVINVMKDPGVNCSAGAGEEVHSRCGSSASGTVQEEVETA